MLGLSVPELLIALCAVAVGVSAVRALRPAARTRPEVTLTADQRTHLRLLVMQGQENRAVKEVRGLTGLKRADAKRVLSAVVDGDPPTGTNRGW